MTTMSSRRFVTPVVAKTKPSAFGLFDIAYGCGLAALIAGVHFEQTAIAGIGFAVFVSSVLYEVARNTFTE